MIESIVDVLSLPYTEAKRRLLAAFDAAYVAHKLDENGGNRSAAARASGMDRGNFKRLVRRSVS